MFQRPEFCATNAWNLAQWSRAAGGALVRQEHGLPPDTEARGHVIMHGQLARRLPATFLWAPGALALSPGGKPRVAGRQEPLRVLSAAAFVRVNLRSHGPHCSLDVGVAGLPGHVGANAVGRCQGPQEHHQSALRKRHRANASYGNAQQGSG